MKNRNPNNGALMLALREEYHWESMGECYGKPATFQCRSSSEHSFIRGWKAHALLAFAGLLGVLWY